ncbi:tRNA threonylcarbamoyladenosine dehydratase [Sedimentisphaera salicampi]|uniref:Molybdopterin-synthase adenylyltransferase n=1 Tax=Sedimentisphaera salicampi TaxID=1941349 RepID=A0A1W6LMM3_9BACT|nr:tRNA threonylcarbamoyladenosine dehydratase [Sedimentisphaera salicampi]ARN57038.1 Molybdopterin-synthase adenylyltransferase [Sedimentisphaera salicampi]OXU14876.1 Molybdopterin-synthase adenylyltransferase [Sedimentisphaera salicampi]
MTGGQDFRERLKRTELLLGKENIEKLASSFVVVCGTGAVGSFAAEALARAGTGKIRLIDSDKISKSNINRQVFALTSTEGRYKTEAGKQRIIDINPHCTVETLNVFIHTDTLEKCLDGSPDFVIDSIDPLNPKLELITELSKREIPFISSMGAARKTDPSKIRISAMREVRYCPLAANLRKRLRKRGVSLSFPAVYSSQQLKKQSALAPADSENPVKRGHIQGRKRNLMGSLPTITGIFGLLAADYAIKKLTT